MSKLTVTQANLYYNKKDGSPLIDKKGMKYARAVIKANEYGAQTLTGFVYRNIVPGDVIEAKITTEQYLGKPQLRFEIEVPATQKAAAAQGTSEVLSEMKTHTVLMKQILDKVDGIYMSISTHQTIEMLKKEPAKETPEESPKEDDFGDAFPD